MYIARLASKEELKNTTISNKKRTLKSENRKEYNILSIIEVKELENLFKTGIKTKQYLLAKQYNVCPSTISRIYTGQHTLSTLDYKALLKGLCKNIHKKTTL